MFSDFKTLFKMAFLAVFFLTIFTGCRAQDDSVPLTPAELTALSVTPENPSIAPGTTIQLTARGIFSNGSNQNMTSSVNWESSAPGTATVGNLSGSKGLVSAVSAGAATITATSGSISGSTTFIASPVASISVSPLNPPSIAPQTTMQFAASGVLNNSATQDLTSWATWTSSNAAIADVGDAVNTKGLATAVSTGTATITAAYGDVSGTANFKSSALSLISVAPISPSIANGTTQQFTAEGRLADATIQALTTFVTWTSSNATVATISSISGSKGLATAVSEGFAFISSALTGTISNQAVLTVTPAVLTSVTITPASASIALGATQQFIASGSFTDNTTQDITPSVVWSSSNTGVGIISNETGTNGLATATGVGLTTITATSGSRTGSATLSVTPAVLTSISVSPSNPTVIVGFGLQFAATGNFSDGSTQNLTNAVTWSSSSGIASVSDVAGSKGAASTTALGTATITATFGTVSGSTTLTVTSF